MTFMPLFTYFKGKTIAKEIFAEEIFAIEVVNRKNIFRKNFLFFLTIDIFYFFLGVFVVAVYSLINIHNSPLQINPLVFHLRTSYFRGCRLEILDQFSS